jgi:hypothetical protein
MGFQIIPVHTTREMEDFHKPNSRQSILGMVASKEFDLRLKLRAYGMMLYY